MDWQTIEHLLRDISGSVSSANQKWGHGGLQELLDPIARLHEEVMFAREVPVDLVPQNKQPHVVEEKLAAVRVHASNYAEDGPTSRIDVSTLEAELTGSALALARAYRPMHNDSVQLRLELGKINDAQRELASTFEEAIAAARQQNADTASEALSSEYEEEANAHKNAAKWSLAASLVSCGALVAVAAYFLQNGPSTGGQGQDVGLVVADIFAHAVVISTIAFVAGLFARNYRANKHLETLNRRRVTALKTSTKLRQAIGDEYTRDLVTAALVESIFSTSDDTGFASGSADRTVVESPNGALTMVQGLSRNAPNSQS